ncbi:MAG: DUF134 domain-containing protein [Sulfurospirillaceae bacterium]|jgi:predicted DNA-binding protein (UPF0251 family)/predicted Fe-Mo cluster-binding NifX family protein|nr:DUF134 domain-containing protein [Sulfurospirillaceae bacterium]MDD2826099.1 DUF134 domain-containing protein [Sulfurospirillaceae bacterium]
MSRQKNKRHISFRPRCHKFIPENNGDMEIISLLSEETEALYLMDLLGMYQEEAAQKMEISRPTLARIVKSAHHKVALALLGGKQLNLEPSSAPYKIALCSDSANAPFYLTLPKSKYIHIFTLNHHIIESHKILNNPLFLENAKPAIVLTTLFTQERINLFIANSLGEGFKSMLSSKGIQLLIKESMSEEDIRVLW